LEVEAATHAADFAKFDSRDGRFAFSFNLQAAILGCFWYFSRRLSRKGFAIVLAAWVTATVPVTKFILAVATFPLLAVQVFTGNSVGPDGTVMPTRPAERASQIERLLIAVVVLIVLWRLFRGVGRRCALLLAVGFASDAVLHGMAIPALWITSGMLANYDLYLLVRARATQAPALAT
jgi:hypothetical protein